MNSYLDLYLINPPLVLTEQHLLGYGANAIVYKHPFDRDVAFKVFDRKEEYPLEKLQKRVEQWKDNEKVFGDKIKGKYGYKPYSVLHEAVEVPVKDRHETKNVNALKIQRIHGDIGVDWARKQAIWMSSFITEIGALEAYGIWEKSLSHPVWYSVEFSLDYNKRQQQLKEQVDLLKNITNDLNIEKLDATIEKYATTVVTYENILDYLVRQGNVYIDNSHWGNFMVESNTGRLYLVDTDDWFERFPTEKNHKTMYGTYSPLTEGGVKAKANTLTKYFALLSMKLKYSEFRECFVLDGMDGRDERPTYKILHSFTKDEQIEDMNNQIIRYEGKPDAQKQLKNCLDFYKTNYDAIETSLLILFEKSKQAFEKLRHDNPS